MIRISHRVLIRAASLAFAIICTVVSLPRTSEAQTTTPTLYYACYVPLTGNVYRIKEPGLPQACTSVTHVQFSWNQQGSQGVQGIQGI